MPDRIVNVAMVLLVAVGFGCSSSHGALEAEPEPEPELPMIDHSPVLLAQMVPAKIRQPLVFPAPPVCSPGMVLVEGNFCPKVEQTCKRYLDPPGRYEQFRCAEYGPPRCLSRNRVFMRFCIDIDEYTAADESLPQNFMSFTHAERLCAEQHKRVCLESEWNFACEGEEMRPYPYGFQRDSSACNADQRDIVGDDGKLKDLRVPSDSFPRCTSPFGVRNMAGNLEEFVAIDASRPRRPAMKGAYWQPSRNHCRAAQTAHDRYYNGMETGFRCCAEAQQLPEKQRARPFKGAALAL